MRGQAQDPAAGCRAGAMENQGRSQLLLLETGGSEKGCIEHAFPGPAPLETLASNLPGRIHGGSRKWSLNSAWPGTLDAKI